MYTKIKNPARYALSAQLFIFGLICLTFIVIIIYFIIISEWNVSFLWEQAKDLFNFAKKEKGILAAMAIPTFILLIPIGLIAGIIEWFKKRSVWDNPSAVYALDFAPDKIIVYTKQKEFCLLCSKTKLSVNTEMITVRTKHSSHPAPNAFTMVFTDGENSFTVNHKFNYKFLYALADLHKYFKDISFEFTANTAQQEELASFLKEQIENQKRFGMHRRYHNYLHVAIGGIMFIGLAIFVTLMIYDIFDHRFFMSWILVLLVLLLLFLLAIGIQMIYSVVKDIYIAHKIKQLEGLN